LLVMREHHVTALVPRNPPPQALLSEQLVIT
jgi:hypothetical protein